MKEVAESFQKVTKSGSSDRRWQKKTLVEKYSAVGTLIE